MRAVAYCRVSTNKEEQLDSMESQQRFFAEYAARNGYELVRIYADEGKSGTKMKNRPQLLRLLSDAGKGMFELVLIKDVSRLARNTLDFLTSVRRLKALGIKVSFVNYDQTSSDSSEFMLTMLSAIAQEESANTSKRVKFGKRQNAEQGKVPNLVYGYDKIPGDYFHYNTNEKEAAIIRRIFTMYTKEGMGASRIASLLNKEGLKTKRCCDWTQTAVGRILSNEIYIGKVINGKQRVEDFLTGKRSNTKTEEWLVTERPELKIVEEETFRLAQNILNSRKNTFCHAQNRTSDKYPLSQLIKCSQCGSSYRRLVRAYKNTYITWVCNGRNSKGIAYCSNLTVVQEEKMIDAIRDYFMTILLNKPTTVQWIIKEVNRQGISEDELVFREKEAISLLNKLAKEKQKFMEMFQNDIITIEELKNKTKLINKNLQYYEDELEAIQEKMNRKFVQLNTDQIDCHNICKVLMLDQLTNKMLRQIIEKIEVDERGNVDIYLFALS